MNKNESIAAAAPHIFKRPLLFVDVHDSMLQAATFLAIGPQIYADGLVVFDGKKLAGRIGGLALVQHILATREKWLEFKAVRVTGELKDPLEASAPVSDALRAFQETRFAFFPVSFHGEISASLSIRDLLWFYAKQEISTKAVSLASEIIPVSQDTNVLDSLKIMAEQKIRNLVFMQSGLAYMINDRKILEFMLSYNAREILKSHGFAGLGEIPLASLGFMKGKQISKDATTRDAALQLTDVSTPCLFYERRVLTPWDLIMKQA